MCFHVASMPGTPSDLNPEINIHLDLDSKNEGDLKYIQVNPQIWHQLPLLFRNELWILVRSVCCNLV